MTILKSIVICLALANVGYFLWVRGIAHAPSAADASAPQTTLRLASEAPAGAHAAPAAGLRAPAGDGGSAAGGLVGASGGDRRRLQRCRGRRRRCRRAIARRRSSPT